MHLYIYIPTQGHAVLVHTEWFSVDGFYIRRLRCRASGIVFAASRYRYLFVVSSVLTISFLWIKTRTSSPTGLSHSRQLLTGRVSATIKPQSTWTA